MGYTVRDLFLRVSSYRPDLASTGQMEFFLQEAVRRVMKETFLANVVQHTFYLPTGVDQILFTSKIPAWDVVNNQPNMNYVPVNQYITVGGNTVDISQNCMILPAFDTLSTINPAQPDPVDILRITRMRVAQLGTGNPSSGYFRGYAKTLPVATTFNQGDFVIMVNNGTTSLTNDGTPQIFNVDDVLVWSGTYWNYLASEQFNLISEMNGPSYRGSNLSPQFPVGATTGWSQMNGRMNYNPVSGTSLNPGYQGFSGMLVSLFSASQQDTAFIIDYSCVPVGDFGNTELNLSDEARDAVVNCALADILLLPGEHQNMYMASSKKMEYEQQKAALCAIGVLGMGAAPTFNAPRFTPNGGRLWPYYFQPLIPPGY